MRKTYNCLGENISRYCFEHDLSAADFAEKLGRTMRLGEDALTARAVQKWISGESYPTVEKLIGISRLLGVSVDDLLKDDIDDFGKKSRSKTERLSEEGMALLEKLCAGAEAGEAEVYYKLFVDADGRAALSKEPLYGYAAIEADYKAVLADAAKKERTGDFLRDMNTLRERGKELSADELIREYLRYTDIALCEAFVEEENPERTAAVREESFYHYGKYDGNNTILRVFSEKELPPEVPHPSPAENKYYYSAIYSDAQNAEVLLFSSPDSHIEEDERTAKMKKIERQGCDEADKLLAELIENGIVRRRAEQEAFCQINDKHLEEDGCWQLDEIAAVNYYLVPFEILLPEEEIVEFLCTRYREKLVGRERK